MVRARRRILNELDKFVRSLKLGHYGAGGRNRATPTMLRLLPSFDKVREKDE